MKVMNPFEDYPLDDRCRWWCEMNVWRPPDGFPFKLPMARTQEWAEIFHRLSQATPEPDRMKLWREDYC